ncbi:conserved Plasmodium protein, unknown function [Plasmodium gallinaceum]|uniref:ER membrane protein complex subunit 10 n=1 Tax=Plasmodium gallinaceum TaxID=5849 RepID=A0A1J1GSC1_PLAGA|nr:conserved Plasmodium protein, unknown function [Plasmodium gallinaceum]CRG95393.1 conserved Plasmodium protein, unknown function [Plasmodium gallinaceum]
MREKILYCIFYLFLIPVFCNKNIIELNYEINSYSLNNDKWNNIGYFILNNNEIHDTSNIYLGEKKKFIEKLKGEFDYVLFQLCYNVEEQKCIQTYVDKSRIYNIENFILLIGLDNNYLPFVMNYKTYEEYQNTKIFSGMFAIKVLSVSLPIDINNLTEENKIKTKANENMNEKEKKEPKSFLRKYWYVIVIFFISLSISKHLTENMPQTNN